MELVVFKFHEGSIISKDLYFHYRAGKSIGQTGFFGCICMLQGDLLVKGER